MVRNIINKNRDTFKYVVVGLSGLFVLLTLVGLFFNFGGGFFSIVASFLNFLILAALLGALVYTILAKKDDLARKLGIALLIYWSVNILLSFASPLARFTAGNFWVILYAIFEFLALLSYVACIVLYVVTLLTKKDFDNIINYASIAHVGFMILYFAFRIIATIFTGAKFSAILDAACLTSMSCLAVIGYYLIDKKHS